MSDIVSGDDLGDDIDDELEDDWDEDELLDFSDLEVARTSVVLTVAEGKRLIAKGIAAEPMVRAAMESGMVAVCKGTTNAYVLEELLGRDIEKGKYVLGRTVPEGRKDAQKAFAGDIPEVVFKDGEPVEGLTVADAVREMEPGDVVLKGANALDYRNNIAGLLIGHPEGGTLGAVLGSVYGKGLNLIVPIGLEKQISLPMQQVVAMADPQECAEDNIPRLWPFEAILFTEIEALGVLADVTVTQIGAGGVCGAEGAVWLLVAGFRGDVEAAREIITSVQGEPSFWDAVMGE